jgi:hypothetical protein
MQRETIVRFIEKRSDPRIPRDDERFRKEVNALVRLLMQWEMLELFAIHEAGHEIYFRRAGFRDFTYAPPTVIYRETNKEQPFYGQPAQIIPGKDYTKPDHDDWLLDLAKGTRQAGNAQENSQLPTTAETQSTESCGTKCAHPAIRTLLRPKRK